MNYCEKNYDSEAAIKVSTKIKQWIRPVKELDEGK